MTRVTHIEVVTEEREIVDDFICNRCGRSCKDREGLNPEGLIEAAVCGGYASKLGDRRTLRFSLCESCLEELFASFAIQPWDSWIEP